MPLVSCVRPRSSMRGGLPCPDQFPALCARPVVALDVAVQNLLEPGYDGVAAQRSREFAVNVDGGFGFLEGAGEADAEVRVFRFAGAVDDAAHDRDLQFFDAGVLLAPLGHGGAEVGLDLFGQLLEVSARRASATGA